MQNKMKNLARTLLDAGEYFLSTEKNKTTQNKPSPPTKRTPSCGGREGKKKKKWKFSRSTPRPLTGASLAILFCARLQVGLSGSSVIRQGAAAEGNVLIKKRNTLQILLLFMASVQQIT